MAYVGWDWSPLAGNPNITLENLPPANITLTNGRYSVTIPEQSILDKYQDSHLHTVVDMDPFTNTINMNQEFITPTVLLTIKYLYTGSIIDSNDSVISADTFQAIRNMLTGEDNKNIEESARYLQLKDLKSIDLSSLPEPIGISRLIALRSGNTIYFDGTTLYTLSRDGPIGTIIRLNSHVRIIDVPITSDRLIEGLSYLSSSSIQSGSSTSSDQLDLAYRYFLIDDLNNPIIRAYLSCPHMNEQESEVRDPVTIYSEPHNYGVIVSRSKLLSQYPNSMLATALELDPNTSVIPVINPNITSEALDAVQDLLNAPLEYDPDLVQGAQYLGIPELSNPYLALLIVCYSE